MRSIKEHETTRDVLVSSSRTGIPYLNIVFPVRNEESRLEDGIRRTIEYLEKEAIVNYVITIADNDSSDATAHISQGLCYELPQIISYIRIQEKGVGAAFREAVARNESPIIGYMDIDLATDLHHIADMLTLFRDDEDLVFVNGSRWANGYWSTGRGLKRTIFSIGLTTLLKQVLGMEASDAICGFKFFRKEAAERLVATADEDDSSWFFIIEMLLNAERSGFKIYELPVKWHDDGHSSVEVFSVMKAYLKQIIRLRKRFREHDEER